MTPWLNTVLSRIRQAQRNPWASGTWRSGEYVPNLQWGSLDGPPPIQEKRVVGPASGRLGPLQGGQGSHQMLKKLETGLLTAQFSDPSAGYHSTDDPFGMQAFRSQASGSQWDGFSGFGNPRSRARTSWR
jgi:hypothetical protein